MPLEVDFLGRKHMTGGEPLYLAGVLALFVVFAIALIYGQSKTDS